MVKWGKGITIEDDFHIIFRTEVGTVNYASRAPLARSFSTTVAAK